MTIFYSNLIVRLSGLKDNFLSLIGRVVHMIVVSFSLSVPYDTSVTLAGNSSPSQVLNSPFSSERRLSASSQVLKEKGGKIKSNNERCVSSQTVLCNTALGT